MSRFIPHGFARIVLTTALLVTGLVVGPLTVHNAGATLSTCGGALCFDPVVFLSDGTHVQTGVGVDDKVHDIQGITYVVHVPAGLTVDRVTYQGSVRQQVQVYSDEQSPSSYDVDTQVFTGVAGTEVIPYTVIKKHGPGQPCSSSGTGLSNQDVFVHIDC
jgi:hypothetical protein